MRRNTHRFLNESDNQAKVRKAAIKIADFLRSEYPDRSAKHIMNDIIQMCLEEPVVRKHLHSDVSDRIYDKYGDSRLGMLADEFKAALDQSIQWDMVDLRDKYFH